MIATINTKIKQWYLLFDLPLNQYFECSTHFKNKTKYAPYVSPESQISHIATNKGNINRQCLNI